MKKIFRFLLVATAVFGGFTACSEDELAPEMTFHKETISATVVEQLDPVGSKTCVDINNLGHGYMGFLWQREDSIGVFGKGTTRNEIFKNTIFHKAAQADFSGNVADGDKSWRAYYPYNPANEGRNYNELLGNIPAEQPFDHESGRLVADYKYGAPIADGSSQFNFRHMFSMLRFDVDATGSTLEGESLESIELTITDANGNPRNINGSFTFSAENGEWGNVTNATNKIRMPWTSAPVLSKDKSYLGFMTLMPDVKAGDNIAVTIYTTDHKATFTAKCLVDFVKETVYNIPLKLKEYYDRADKFGYTETSLPKINSFKFEVSKNSGKLLNNKLTWSSKKPSFSSVSEHPTTITYGESSNDITVTIPYLYDFKLKPTFTVPSGCTVTVNGVVQKSGESEVDFSKPVNYVVTDAAGDFRKYTVKVQNTGLPVVVLNQDHNDVKNGFEKDSKDFWAGLAGKYRNKFVDFMVRRKNDDDGWATKDEITIYNPDGSVDMATALCGTRLRGNTTQDYPKKPLAIKFVNKQSVLGMPAHKRWVLLANWLDHSMIRNTVAFDIAHIIEAAWRNEDLNAGIPWNVHGQNVELVIDGHHVGNYYLCEQIKIDGGRLDIKDTYEDVVKKQGSASFADCGYLFECDNNYDEDQQFITSKFSVPFMFKDAVSDDILTAVKNKINGIANNIGNGKYTEAYKDFDIYSAIDQFLIFELTMNREYVDPRSVYYFMDGNGPLSAGPVWDFDRGTFHNPTKAKDLGGDRIKQYDGWICLSANPKDNLSSSKLENASSCVFYPQLINDTTFQNALKKRWEVLYQYLSAYGELVIRSYGEKMAKSYEYNNAMWPTTKADIQAWKSGFSDWSGDETISVWSDVVENMVTVWKSRLAGINTLITSGNFTKEAM